MKLLVRLLVRLLTILAVVLLGLWAVLSFGWQPDDFPTGSDSAARLQTGPYSVIRETRNFVDERRPTPANREFPGESQRRLEGDLWYPGDASDPVPLLLFSHGFTSMRANGAYLAEHLASHGFAVLAVDYPLTSMGAPGGPAVEDVANQPGDISFLIDSLLADNADPGHALHGRIAASRIGVFGISLGGLTSTLAGFHPRWGDPRVGAVLSIAGPSNFFTPLFFAQRADLPFLMLAGDLDVLVPHASNAAPLPGKFPGAELVTIRGGSHTGFSGGTGYLRFMDNTDALGCFSVQRFIDEGGTNEAGELLGADADGIDLDVDDELCKVDPLPEAMNVLRQQMIARVVVTAFFEKTLAAEPARREAAKRFLEEGIALELAEVAYQRGSALQAGR